MVRKQDTSQVIEKFSLDKQKATEEEKEEGEQKHKGARKFRSP